MHIFILILKRGTLSSFFFLRQAPLHPMMRLTMTEVCLNLDKNLILSAHAIGHATWDRITSSFLNVVLVEFILRSVCK